MIQQFSPFALAQLYDYNSLHTLNRKYSCILDTRALLNIFNLMGD